ncbi:hypothetical protein PFLA_b0943 [Pseudoalteromonas flavipulchra NCIMB 2033 = ATCC BAA-314]|nr:hypothetical protein [Pseudoalteromonas flavipulchra NCIMB 2033 = ATCC BAA-314]
MCLKNSEDNMSNKSLSARIPAYKMVFASGELQKTYKDLVSIV